MHHVTGPYYESSGRAPLGGVGLSLLLGLLAGTSVAFVYGYLLVYIPIAGYITFLFAAGFGFCAAFATSFGLTMGKVRSHAVSIVVVAIVALVSFYASWVAWTYALLNKSGVSVSLAQVANPGELWRLVNLINNVGAWSMFGGTPKGGALWALWAVEALIIFGSIVVFSGVLAPPSPFCEECNDWCEEGEGIATFAAPPDVDSATEQCVQLVRHLEGKDWAVLEAQGPPDTGDVYYRVDEQVCEDCLKTCLLSLNHVTVEVDEDGDLDEDVTPMMENLVVTLEELTAVRELGERIYEQRQQELGEASYPEEGPG